MLLSFTICLHINVEFSLANVDTSVYNRTRQQQMCGLDAKHIMKPNSIIAYLPKQIKMGGDNLYEKIKRIAKDRGISVREVERRCGFAYGTLQRWSKISPMVDKVWKVSRVLNVTVDELMDHGTDIG